MGKVKIKIKKNDIVKVMAGASKGKEGKLLLSCFYLALLLCVNYMTLSVGNILNLGLKLILALIV